MGWRMTVLTLTLLAVDVSMALPSLLGSNQNHPHHHDSNHDLHQNHANDDSEDYYDEDPDRSYKFSFEADEHSREESADENGLVTGKYTYTDENGNSRTLTYRAGAGIGFVPDLDKFGSFGKKVVIKKRRKPLSAPSRLVKSLIPPQQHSQQLTQQPQAPQGYLAPPVAEPSTLYDAPTPPQTLFEATYAAPLPLPPPPQETPTSLYQAPSTQIEYQQTADSEYQQTADSGYQQTADSKTTTPMMRMDASYSFKYDDADLSRTENADPNGDVQGSYSYTSPEGKTILVKYSAGAGKGFVIENEEELSNAVDEANKAAELAIEVQESFDEPLHSYGQVHPSGAIQDEDRDAEILSAKDSNVEYDTVDEASIYFEQPTIDQDTWIQSKSYKFEYSGTDNNLFRKEISDENGVVSGSYTIPDVNGDPIEVRYKAGPLIGFIIENLEEVQERTNPESKISDQNQETDQSALPTIISARKTSQTTPHVTPKASTAVIPPKPFIDPLHEENSDRSYKFSYGSEEEDNLRREESDSDGNIRGKYRYVNKEGNAIEVKYSAGPHKGFVVENSEELQSKVAKATSDGAKKGRKMRVVKRPRNKGSSSNHATSTNHYAKSRGQSKHQGISRSFTVPSTRGNTYHDTKESHYDVNERHDDSANMDASFSFKAETEDSSHEEHATSNGERTGSYSYTDPHGKLVVVKYRAGRNGFEILNPDEVLPKPPQAY